MCGEDLIKPLHKLFDVIPNPLNYVKVDIINQTMSISVKFVTTHNPECIQSVVKSDFQSLLESFNYSIKRCKTL